MSGIVTLPNQAAFRTHPARLFRLQARGRHSAAQAVGIAQGPQARPPTSPPDLWATAAVNTIRHARSLAGASRATRQPTAPGESHSHNLQPRDEAPETGSRGCAHRTPQSRQSVRAGRQPAPIPPAAGACTGAGTQPAPVPRCLQALRRFPEARWPNRRGLRRFRPHESRSRLDSRGRARAFFPLRRCQSSC